MKTTQDKFEELLINHIKVIKDLDKNMTITMSELSKAETELHLYLKGKEAGKQEALKEKGVDCLIV